MRSQYKYPHCGANEQNIKIEMYLSLCAVGPAPQFGSHWSQLKIAFGEVFFFHFVEVCHISFSSLIINSHSAILVFFIVLIIMKHKYMFQP